MGFPDFFIGFDGGKREEVGLYFWEKYLTG